MRRSVTLTIVLAITGLLGGGLFRYIFNDPSEASVANYLRSCTHGVALALVMGSVHLYFSSRSSAWVRRWPFVVELLIRSITMAVVLAITAIAMEVILYDHRIEFGWIAGDFPKIMGFSLGLSVPFSTAYELTRMTGGRTLLHVLLGRYRRPIREQRVLLFLDLVGSTSLAEAMGELRVQELLTRFFFDIDEAIVSHGGEVHAYVGDEVIVTWPVNASPSSRRYLDCVFAIDDRLAELADDYRREFGTVPAFRAGMHAGTVVISECGDSRRQLAYFGDTVNVTARLQQHCKVVGRALLVSGELLRLLPEDANVIIEPLGATRLRGRAAPIEIFAVARREAATARRQASS
ncbi:adenylate/guanylate cyclase domain-containing protein [Bradyrhizobium jicamae]|uniref:adenylate/guanylate cyclase domain-containing protein n=1 Tax=Bradyrhizobium jicamae TaxID=280332 RepID=UPI001BA7CFCC|nr:adenylate/guanylate cyclase domain-containing protein [Bradyrhizobium jicamae]MBR0938441.1 adenylate/guanylate cyclase domain-containing protein [Bradyrhizobium jicamae]